MLPRLDWGSSSREKRVDTTSSADLVMVCFTGSRTVRFRVKDEMRSLLVGVQS